MPICDGFTASRRIREFSQSRGADFERHPVTGGFVPVFAVSASLQENQRQQLLDCGFSGFILKPLDFSRLGDLMQGTSSRDARDACQYVPGRWEKGGWLFNSDSEKDNTDSPKPT
jgi:CheY-like chemotaxis protein